jgi:hypothetical protein
VSIRATAAAGGGTTIVAEATTDGSTITPVSGSGSLRVEGSLALELSARIDTSGIDYEGVVDSFEYAIEPVEEAFDPFAIDAEVEALAMLPAAELGRVPIPSVPGATLVLEVTGGEITTTFGGTCAEAKDGFAQYAGTLTTSGTVACAATVEIEIPVIGTESFGPFAFDVAIPATGSAIDLGTRSLSTGEDAEAMGICEPDVGETSTPTTTGTSGPSGTDDGSDDAASGTTSGGEDSTGASASGEPTTGEPTPDPDYPHPDACDPDQVAVSVGDDMNGVCLPQCGPSGECPSGATGTAVGVCGFNPMSTFLDCMTDDDCTPGEMCIDGVCFYEPPTHCVLFCDVGAVCPDGMTCVLDVCTYPL